MTIIFFLRCQIGPYCKDNPCKNSGKCIDSLDGPVCECEAGFHGERWVPFVQLTVFMAPVYIACGIKILTRVGGLVAHNVTYPFLKLSSVIRG